jgi:HAD superfamily hydrolase (TIGR01509 family)
MFKGILFDMDGVLLDSEYLTSEATILYFKEKGFEVKHEDFFPFYGTGERGYFGGVAEKYGISFDVEKEKYAIYDLFAEIARGKMKPMPGVPELLNKIKKLNLKIAVATSASRYKMKINLNLIGMKESTFDTLITGEDINRNKPNPDIFLKAAFNLGLKPQECLVVEDAPGGVEAAKKAGCKCLAVMTSFSEKELEKADWIVKDLINYPKEIFR